MSEVVNSFETQWYVEDLKAKAEDLAVDELSWFKHANGAEIGVDWVAGDVYIIDPDSPDFPQVEIAQFEGIDQLFKPEEEK